MEARVRYPEKKKVDDTLRAEAAETKFNRLWRCGEMHSRKSDVQKWHVDHKGVFFPSEPCHTIRRRAQSI